MRWVVVGAGAAGGVVASRLSEDPDDRVTVIEHGPDLTASTTPRTIRDTDYTAALTSDRVDRSHSVRRRRDSSPEPYPVGRGVGGSGAINGMLMSRGDIEQYESWGWADIDEALSRVLIPAAPVADTMLGPVDRALLAADSSARRTDLAIRSGRRITVADAYLDAARARPNLTVRVGSAAHSIVHRDGRAAGVALDDGTTLEADAVVLCAGALVSPVILLRSGDWGVPVGEGLQDHPSVTVTFRLRCSSDGGIRSDPGSTVTSGVVVSDGALQVAALNRVGHAAEVEGLGALMATVLRPRSRGRVALDDDGGERIEVNELDDAADLAQLVDGVERLRALVTDPLFTEVIEDPGGEGVTIDEVGTSLSSLRTPDDVATWLRTRPRGGSVLHAAATCPMGRVVDTYGRVGGAPNLFVVDASIFPSVPAAPTYLPTLMLAERMVPRVRAAVAR